MKVEEVECHQLETPPVTNLFHIHRQFITLTLIRLKNIFMKGEVVECPQLATPPVANLFHIHRQFLT